MLKVSHLLIHHLKTCGKEKKPGNRRRDSDTGYFLQGHFIDFVPNQNSLGHMMAWLATDQFKDLAECPSGYKIMGLMNMKGTIDPVDPRSIGLVTKMTDDLLPNFTSPNFNVNLDEPFELGKGKARKLASKRVKARCISIMLWKCMICLPGKTGRWWCGVILYWGILSLYQKFQKTSPCLTGVMNRAILTKNMECFCRNQDWIIWYVPHKQLDLYYRAYRQYARKYWISCKKRSKIRCHGMLLTDWEIWDTGNICR